MTGEKGPNGCIHVVDERSGHVLERLDVTSTGYMDDFWDSLGSGPQPNFYDAPAKKRRRVPVAFRILSNICSLKSPFYPRTVGGNMV